MQIRKRVVDNVLVVVLISCTWCVSNCSRCGVQESTTQESTEQYVFEFSVVDGLRQQANQDYIKFLDVNSLHCGIYSLKTGAKDGQQPHAQDEVYYIESGVAKINIEGQDFALKKGSIVFVPANVKHEFHSITEDLRTLVFFSKGPITTEDDNP